MNHLSQSRTANVKQFFDQTRCYLEKNVNIEIRKRIVRELVGDIRNSRILDLGCGDGSISLQFLNETNYISLVDLSPNMLAIARENTPAQCKVNVGYINRDL